MTTTERLEDRVAFRLGRATQLLRAIVRADSPAMRNIAEEMAREFLAEEDAR